MSCRSLNYFIHLDLAKEPQFKPLLKSKGLLNQLKHQLNELNLKHETKRGLNKNNCNYISTELLRIEATPGRNQHIEHSRRCDQMH